MATIRDCRGKAMDVKAIIAHIYQMHSILTKEEEILHALAWLQEDSKLTETPPTTTTATPAATPPTPATTAPTVPGTAPETATTAPTMPGTAPKTTTTADTTVSTAPKTATTAPTSAATGAATAPATAPPTLPLETEKSRVNEGPSEDTGNVARGNVEAPVAKPVEAVVAAPVEGPKTSEGLPEVPPVQAIDDFIRRGYHSRDDIEAYMKANFEGKAYRDEVRERFRNVPERSNISLFRNVSKH